MRRTIARLLICSHLLILPLGVQPVTGSRPVSARGTPGSNSGQTAPSCTARRRDVAQYRVEDAQIVITSPEGTTTGRIVNPATVEFPPGTNAVAEAFGGVWVFRPVGAVVELGDVQARAAAAALVGAWRIRGETDVLDFQADGTYTWGRLSGTYKMLDALRVRMTMDEDGRRIGQLDNGFVVDGDELRLTAPDGADRVERVR